MRSDPAMACVAVTPADDTDLPGGVCRSLLLGAAGAVKITDASGNTTTPTMPAGYNPIQVVRVWSTGTTATGIHALY